MELRGCSNLHYISAIKDGLVIKIHNVNSRGRPGLVFKDLKDIYGTESDRNPDAQSTLELQGEREHKIESPCLPVAERKTCEANILNCNGIVDERYSDSDDSFGKMTLKRLKKTCKTKKRKFSDLACLIPKQEFTNSQPEDDEDDLKTTLSSLKSKLSKKAKSRKKCTERSVSATPKPAPSIKTEQILIAEDLQQSSNDICAPITIKVELPGLDYSECEAMNYVTDGSSICNEQASFCGVDFISEVLQTADNTLENKETLSLTEEYESCVLNEVSYSHLDVVDPTPFPPVSSDTTELDIQNLTGQHPSVSHVAEYLEEACTQHSPSSQSSKIVFSAEDRSSDMCNSSQSCFSMEDVCGNDSGYQVYSECEAMNYVTDGSSICNKQAGFCNVDSISEVLQIDNMLENKETLSLTGEYESCVLNEVSYSHLDVVDPNPFLPVSSDTTELNTQNLTGQHSSVSCVSEFLQEACIQHSPSSRSSQIDLSAKDQSSDMCNSSQSCFNMQEMCGNDSGYQVSDVATNDILCCTKTDQESEICMLEDGTKKSSAMCISSHSSGNDSSYQVSNVVIDDSLCGTDIGNDSELCMFEDTIREKLPQNLENGSMSNTSTNSSSARDCYPCSNPDSELVSLGNYSPTFEDKQPLKSNIADTERNCLKPNDLTVLEDDSFPSKEQLLISDTADAERSFSSGGINEFSTSKTNNYHGVEWWQSPERLPSARKAISPTSQERLCLAMNSVELYDDLDHYKCKGKLLFGTQVESKTFPEGSDSEGVESSTKGESCGQVARTKAVISPRKILKKPTHNKKGSPPKGCLGGGRLSRSLPHLSTGCTSIEGCSESAIAFSQRQMHDIESLAGKLMTELKSMKDIVEGKLLFEAYRSASLKNDADEVQRAIKSAKKVEQTANKWLSMMARDCNRFCKIMKLTEDGSAATENVTPQKEKKKISFADEGGGVLCHVKVFENGMTSLEGESDKQSLQAEEC